MSIAFFKFGAALDRVNSDEARTVFYVIGRFENQKCKGKGNWYDHYDLQWLEKTNDPYYHGMQPNKWTNVLAGNPECTTAKNWKTAQADNKPAFLLKDSPAWSIKGIPLAAENQQYLRAKQFREKYNILLGYYCSQNCAEEAPDMLDDGHTVIKNSKDQEIVDFHIGRMNSAFATMNELRGHKEERTGLRILQFRISLSSKDKVCASCTDKKELRATQYIYMEKGRCTLCKFIPY